MHTLSSSELNLELRTLASGRQLEIREKSGALFAVATPHECLALLEDSMVCGHANKHGLRSLCLTVSRARASKRLRRMLASTGRTVAEASQLVERRKITGGEGVLWQHILPRTNRYAPALRHEIGSLPTYAFLRACVT